MTETVSDTSIARPAECCRQAVIGLIRLSQISDCPERINCVSRWVLLNLIFFSVKNQFSFSIEGVDAKILSDKIGLKIGDFKNSINVLLDCQVLIKEDCYFNYDVVRINPLFLEKLEQKRLIEIEDGGDSIDPMAFFERSIRLSNQATDQLNPHHFIQDLLTSATIAPMTPSLKMVLIVMLLHLRAGGVCNDVALDVVKQIINIDRTMFYRCVEQLQKIGLIRVTIKGAPKQKMLDALPAIYVLDLSHELFVSSRKFYDFYILSYPQSERSEADHFYHDQGVIRSATLLAKKYWFNLRQQPQELAYQQYKRDQARWREVWDTQFGYPKPSEYVIFQDQHGQEVEALNEPLGLMSSGIWSQDQPTTKFDPKAAQDRLNVLCIAMQAHLERIAPYQNQKVQQFFQFQRLRDSQGIHSILKSELCKSYFDNKLNELLAKTEVPRDAHRLSLCCLLMVLTSNLIEIGQAITTQLNISNNSRLSVLPSDRSDRPCRILYRFNSENTSNKFFISSVDTYEHINPFHEIQLDVETQKRLGIRSSGFQVPATDALKLLSPKAKKSRRTHSPELKQSIVDSIRSQRKTIQEVCCEHLLDRSVVHRWLQDANIT